MCQDRVELPPDAESDTITAVLDSIPAAKVNTTTAVLDSIPAAKVNTTAVLDSIPAAKVNTTTAVLDSIPAAEVNTTTAALGSTFDITTTKFSHAQPVNLDINTDGRICTGSLSPCIGCC